MLEALSAIRLVDQKEELSSLRQISQQLKAINHHHRNITTKTLQSLDLNLIIQEELRMVRRSFQLWKEKTYIRKIQNKIVCGRLFRKFKEQKIRKQRKMLSEVQLMAAENHYEKRMKKQAFQEWLKVVLMNKKIEKVMKYILGNRFGQLMKNRQLGRDKIFTKEISSSIYKINLLRRAFNNFHIATKMLKIQKIKLKTSFPSFYQRIQNFNQSENNKCSEFHRIFRLKRIFQGIKKTWQMGKAKRHHQKHLKKHYFSKWIKEVNNLFYEKEEQIKNQDILRDHLERKNQVRLFYAFTKWQNWVSEKKSEKMKNQIAREYGEVKEKQSLLKKCFQAWKLLKKCKIADSFRKNYLKVKGWEGLKAYVLKSAQKWENVYAFVQKREKKKYFQAVKAFNFLSNEKIRFFRQQKSFNLFGKAVVRSYVGKNRKAELYHSRCLLFKSIYTLKKLADLTRKYKKTVIYIHCNMNLQRWAKSHRIRTFVEERKYLMKAKIFRELKLYSMQLKWSQKSKKHLRKEKKKTQDSFQFERITLESPEKMFSLNYSISNYNSNNIFQT